MQLLGKIVFCVSFVRVNVSQGRLQERRLDLHLIECHLSEWSFWWEVDFAMQHLSGLTLTWEWVLCSCNNFRAELYILKLASSVHSATERRSCSLPLVLLRMRERERETETEKGREGGRDRWDVIEVIYSEFWLFSRMCWLPSDDVRSHPSDHCCQRCCRRQLCVGRSHWTGTSAGWVTAPATSSHGNSSATERDVSAAILQRDHSGGRQLRWSSELERFTFGRPVRSRPACQWSVYSKSLLWCCYDNDV